MHDGRSGNRKRRPSIRTADRQQGLPGTILNRGNISLANIFIYGGCVTRDTFQYMKDEHRLVQYVARQSLVSAASKPTTSIKTDGLTDNFQDRAVKGDLESSLHPTLSKYASKTDLFLFDILSERLGVYRLPGGTYITRSVELAKTKLIHTLERPAASISFGTDAHFELWTRAADSFLAKLTDMGLLDRTVLFEAPWTDYTDAGEPVPRFRGWTAEEANELYARYYAYFREKGVRISTLPADLAVSVSTHKWGPSPYHYVDEAYQWMKRQAIEALERPTAAVTEPLVS